MEQLQCKESGWSWTVDELGVLMAPPDMLGVAVCSVPTHHRPSRHESGTYWSSSSVSAESRTKTALPLTTRLLTTRSSIKTHCWIFKMTTPATVAIIGWCFQHVTRHFSAVREPDMSGSLIFNTTKINKRNPRNSNFLRTFFQLCVYVSVPMRECLSGFVKGSIWP